MKSPAVPAASSKSLLRMGCAWALGLLLTLPSPGEDRVRALSPALLLKSAAAGEKTGAPTEAALKAEALMRFGRLLPDGLAPEEIASLVAAASAADVSEEETAKVFARFPAADELIFDGQHYAGANLGYIDALIGPSGRPVAFDRELPMVLVPLKAESDAKLTEQLAKFQTSPEIVKMREAVDLTFGSGASAQTLSDGVFLRTYAGRFDDLYYHLFQNGTGGSALAFSALADGLIDRTYQPVCGIQRRGPATKNGVDLSDILTSGGKGAVRHHLRAQSPAAEEPFQGFAFRIFPSVAKRTVALKTGDRLAASQDEILRALRSREHFYPIQVPALYRSADRFLGWAGSLLIPVAAKPVLPPGAADSWYPLPEQNGPTHADKAKDGAASNQLFENSGGNSAPGIVWEDPQLSNLLADPDRKPDGSKKSAPDPTDPRYKVVPGRLIAVVTPTLVEAKEYLEAIQGSDTKLRTIEQKRGRIRLLRPLLEKIKGAPAEKSNPSETDPTRAAVADLTAINQLDGELAANLQDALKERATLRADWEHRLVTERVTPLETSTEKPAEEHPPTDGKLAL